MSLKATPEPKKAIFLSGVSMTEVFFSISMKGTGMRTYCSADFQAPKAVSTYSSGDVADLALRLDSLLESNSALSAGKAAALAAAENVFSWERQEGTLLSSVENALESRQSAVQGDRGARL